MYHDDQYISVMKLFDDVWFKKNGTRTIDAMRSVYRDGGILLNDINELIKKPLDYFAHAIRLYNRYSMDLWLEGVTYGRRYSSAEFYRMLGRYAPRTYKLYCSKTVGGNYYFREMLVCFERDLTTITKCAFEVIFAKRVKSEPKVWFCPRSFFIPTRAELSRVLSQLDL
ncbi:hypothetical protein B4U80_12546 [Leptotrombidium deliense]|uniref:Uncharacterized protein n=1 Tax=Leptotrombidium deliense TaxID=299467 RepID=A0A443RSG5_9ACAR|nr:hypothetical protein B4U80_12546 [Leptotrombidium deliense]